MSFTPGASITGLQRAICARMQPLAVAGVEPIPGVMASLSGEARSTGSVSVFAAAALCLARLPGAGGQA